MAKQKTCKPPAIETVNVGAAAVDFGSREHMAAVNPDVTDTPQYVPSAPSPMTCMILRIGLSRTG